MISLDFSLITDEQASGFVDHCRAHFDISCAISVQFRCSHIISVRSPFWYYPPTFHLYLCFLSDLFATMHATFSKHLILYLSILDDEAFYKCVSKTYLGCVIVRWWCRSSDHHQKATRFYLESTMGTKITIPEILLNTQDFCEVQHTSIMCDHPFS
jgi:hypothetical protein